MSDGVVYICGMCQQQLSDAHMMQTVRVEQIHPVDESTRDPQLAGKWFHAGCWGDGSAPFPEIDRGSLAEVLG